MTEGKEFTLSELASMALSSPTFDTFHISILQCLVETLLKKLNCEKDMVIIEGLRGTCLDDMVANNSRVPKVRIDDINFTSMLRVENLNLKVVKMEKIIAEIENELTEYTIKVHAVSKAPPPYIWETFEAFACPFADVFDPGASANAHVRDILTNNTFLIAIRDIVGGPLLKRIDVLKRRTKKKHILIRHLQEQMNICNTEAGMIESLIYEYQVAGVLLQRNMEILDKALNELQDMLFAKCDKIHFPEIQHYFWERIKEFEKRIEKLFEELSKCPSRIRWDDIDEKCLSCGGEITPEVKYIPDDQPIIKAKPDPKLEEEEINYCEGSTLPLGGDLIENIKMQEEFADPNVILMAANLVLFGKGFPKPNVHDRGSKKVHHSSLKAPHLELRSKDAPRCRVTISPFRPRERY